jgi:hypothetical protein
MEHTYSTVQYSTVPVKNEENGIFAKNNPKGIRVVGGTPSRQQYYQGYEREHIALTIL